MKAGSRGFEKRGRRIRSRKGTKKGSRRGEKNNVGELTEGKEEVRMSSGVGE